MRAVFPPAGSVVVVPVATKGEDVVVALSRLIDWGSSQSPRFVTRGMAAEAVEFAVVGTYGFATAPVSTCIPKTLNTLAFDEAE